MRSHQTRMTRINLARSWTLEHFEFTRAICHYSREIHYTTYANSHHGRGFCQDSSSLVAKCIPVFVKVRRCLYSSGYPHTTTITLSSIVVWDFLPPLVMTSLLEQDPDWLTRREYPPKFRFFNSRDTLNSCRLIRANSAAGLSFASLH